MKFPTLKEQISQLSKKDRAVFEELFQRNHHPIENVLSLIEQRLIFMILVFLLGFVGFVVTLFTL